MMKAYLFMAQSHILQFLTAYLCPYLLAYQAICLAFEIALVFMELEVETLEFLIIHLYDHEV